LCHVKKYHEEGISAYTGSFYFYSMLTRLKEFNEDELVKFARIYLPLYTNGNVPFMDDQTKELSYVQFMKVNDQWIYIQISRR
jgi:hypothetical protein